MIIRSEPWPVGTPCWVDLMAPDRARAIAFYEALLGWQVSVSGPETGGYGMAEVAGRPVAGIGEIPPDQQMPTRWTTYLAVSDVDATAGAVTAAGGQVHAPPMDVPGAGRMAIAGDAAGAVFGLWQPTGHLGFQVTLAPGAVAWNECMVEDYDAAHKFYGDVFGYSFGDMSGEGFTYTTLEVDGRPVGGLGKSPSDGSRETGWLTYFWAADSDAAAARIPELGGTVLSEPVDTPFGRMVAAKDDQGAYFSLMAPNEQSGTQEGWGA
ncbi:VOC family protein [Amycolatopsis panacis]|uniref:VOC family protein n=1 Tax=Amycolatopsis panacis TaxID=2340917 RepID=A0A419I1W9_9PSEU|nr:VOC family protein [Amycolatopsis panacis]RJQ83771.1 VOC family protein [Amycolatopsis panacis]